MNLVQVHHSQYFSLGYNYKSRWIGYYNQIKEIHNKEVKSILEIGIGNGIIATFLENMNYNMVTVDIDKKLSPDIVSDINYLPFKTDTFDLIACFEVLEHLPYDQSISILKNMKNISKKHVIISIPDSTPFFRVGFILPIIGKYEKVLPKFYRTNKLPKHKFDGEHYWEIGKKDYHLNKIVNDIKSIGFNIYSTYRMFENPYHRYFSLFKTS
ncbi:MAG: methyltransferase domain-containing protein [Calditrichaceae bacterium]|nr:methyltransferase domain-containing protein [Calditrichaceae bacterium]MBN2707480.1 methyltransferase domain-containing protein [Calditrichaceae bacterium]RQV95570.1 MAG: class I SAM-dependent methyltransferase [Calditrichota bacterium]